MERKIIFHIDANAFYASCEIAENGSLKNKPVVIAPNRSKGIILTASYEVRKYGVVSGMPLFMARKLCPKMIVIEPNMHLYEKYSEKLTNYFFSVCEKVEKASIDEAYLDVTEESKKYKNPYLFAQKIQLDILKKYKIPVSIGISTNKFLAKMASDYKKPLGITTIFPDEIKEKLWPIPIEKMHGIGKKTYPRLKNIGINTIGDLANFSDLDKLAKILKNQTNYHLLHAKGKGSSTVEEYNPYNAKSIGNRTTFSKNTDQYDEIYQIYITLVNNVIQRMHEHFKMAKTFTITIKYTNFKTKTRSITIKTPTDEKDEILKQAELLFEKNWQGEKIRLIGFSASELIEKHSTGIQLDLFTYQELNHKNLEVFKKINDKYGEHTIFRANLLLQKKTKKNS